MTQLTEVQREGVSQVAGRILMAFRNGEGMLLKQELEHARSLAAQVRSTCTLEMERMEALSGAVEALRYGYDERSGALRLLEHLATVGATQETRFIN